MIEDYEEDETLDECEDDEAMDFSEQYKSSSISTPGVIIIVCAVVLGGLLWALQGTLMVTKVAPMLSKGITTKIKYDLEEIYKSARMLYVLTGSWPESIRDMVDARDEQGFLPGALANNPKDPWGNEYVYKIRDGKPLIICNGRDGEPGGEGDDQDYEYPESEGR